MAWTSISPVGSISVKANRSTMAGNTTYIETTMGNTAAGTVSASTKDHFWNVSSNLDGHHRFVRSPKFESPAGTQNDPDVGTGMDGVQYIRRVNSDVGRIECFYRNSQGIYQTSPSFLTGSVSMPTSQSTYTTVVAVPKNVYGDIFMYTTALGNKSVAKGFFRSNGSTVEAWALEYIPEGQNGGDTALKFANGSDAVGLNILGRRFSGVSGTQTYNYRITYRAL